MKHPAPLIKSLSDRLQEIARLDHPYPFRSPSSGTPASVLVLLGLSEGMGISELEILITRRGANLETHQGQYAFPGGVQDPEDTTSVDTALREAHEEVGVRPESVLTLGTLPMLWTPTGFQITPVLGLLELPLNQIEIRPNPDEIDIWFWCPLSRLRAEGVYSTETREITLEGKTRAVPMDVFNLDGHRIWGATAAVLKNLIGRWEKLG